jgi:hypothetical protein
LYPEVAKSGFKFGRVHHDVDYRRYKGNALVLRKDFEGVEGSINDYGMKLVKMTAAEARAEEASERGTV